VAVVNRSDTTMKRKCRQTDRDISVSIPAADCVNQNRMHIRMRQWALIDSRGVVV